MFIRIQGKPQKIACPPGNHGLGKVSRSVAGLSQDSSGAAEHSSISARVCVQWCRSEGLVADQLANGVDAPSGQLSPGIWLSTCVNGTMGTGWTHEYVTCTFSAVRAVANRQLPRKGFPQVPARLPRLPRQGRRSLGRYRNTVSRPTPGRTRRLVRCRARARKCASGHTTSYGHGYPADNVEILKTLLHSQHVASPHESDEPRRQAEAESSTACRNADLQGILRGVPARHVTSGQLDRGACTFE